jgi:hypothetical protein
MFIYQLQVPVVYGFFIEGVATLLCRISSKLLSDKVTISMILHFGRKVFGQNFLQTLHPDKNIAQNNGLKLNIAFHGTKSCKLPFNYIYIYTCG